MTYLIVMRIVPALFTFALSLTNWDLTARGGPRFIGLQNYADILTDQAFLDSIGRTLVFTVCATTIELILGLAIALFVHREIRGRNMLRAALITPMVITPSDRKSTRLNSSHYCA